MARHVQSFLGQFLGEHNEVPADLGLAGVHSDDLARATVHKNKLDSARSTFVDRALVVGLTLVVTSMQRYVGLGQLLL